MVHEGLGGGSNALFAVFDGHGVEGEKCSRHVAGHLPSMLAHCAHYKVLRWRARSATIPTLKSGTCSTPDCASSLGGLLCMSEVSGDHVALCRRGGFQRPSRSSLCCATRASGATEGSTAPCPAALVSWPSSRCSCVPQTFFRLSAQGAQPRHTSLMSDITMLVGIAKVLTARSAHKGLEDNSAIRMT